MDFRPTWRDSLPKLPKDPEKRMAFIRGQIQARMDSAESMRESVLSEAAAERAEELNILRIAEQERQKDRDRLSLLAGQPDQLTRADLQSMTREQISEARRAGRLNGILAGYDH